MIEYGIIAAGDGTRIKQEGGSVAKPLVRIGGVPMIGRLITLMAQSGARAVSVIINENMPEVREYLEVLEPNIDCELRFTEMTTMSSFHTFYELLKFMQPEDKYVVTTVDSIFRVQDFEKYVSKFDDADKNIDGLMGVTTYIDDEKPLYVKTDDKDNITGYTDFPERETKYISAGIYGLRNEFFPYIERCMEKGVARMRNFQRNLVEEGLRLKAFDLGKVIDIDHLSDIAKAEKFLAG